MLNRGLDKQELLRIVDSVANEKSIDKELILSSMESAIQKAAYSKFGFDNEIEAKIDREKGNILIQKVLQIVEKVEDPAREISLKDASLIDKKNKFVIDNINENFDLSPRGIREMLNLNKPIYEKTAAYGHFGRTPDDNGSFSWEKTDKISHFSK